MSERASERASVRARARACVREIWEVAVRQAFVIVKRQTCTTKDVALVLEKKVGDCVSVGHGGGSDHLLLLFLWAILTDNIDLAKLFWEEGKVRLVRFYWGIHLWVCVCVCVCVCGCVGVGGWVAGCVGVCVCGCVGVGGWVAGCGCVCVCVLGV